MTSTLPVVGSQTDCWNRIGTSGDRSCPELLTHIHCRNCPVFGSAARTFFERPAPEGYLADWSAILAAPESSGHSKDVSLLIFRLGEEWLALRTGVVVEVTTPRLLHRIPHRSNATLLGMVNLRGQLQLQVALEGLLNANRGGEATGHSRAEERHVRLVVIRADGQTWAFEADEVTGVRRFPSGRLQGVPSTLANPASSFSQAVFAWNEKSVGFLDDRRLFASLKGLGA